MPQKGNNSFKNFIKFQNSKINNKELKFKIFKKLQDFKKIQNFRKILTYIYRKHVDNTTLCDKVCQ
jgi:hypothetical protein